MPRKAKQKAWIPTNRRARSLVTPFVGFPDVLAVIDFETWAVGSRTRYRALLYAVVSVLVACARVKPFSATHLLLADYRADRLVTKGVGSRRCYPIVLLPAAVAIVEAYLKDRDDLGIGGDHLLVDENGAALVYTRIHLEFDRLATRCGHPGGKLIERLVEFYDMQIEKEKRRRKPDHAACICLRRGRRGTLDDRHATSDIAIAADDPERLLRVLARNHDLAGPAGRTVGGHGRAKAREMGKLFSPPKLARRLSPGVLTDEVCVKILGRDWIGKKGVQVEQRQDILDKDGPHLFRLLDDEIINRSDLRGILNCSIGTVRHHETVHRRSLETDDERRMRERIEADWRDRAPKLYSARMGGETFPDFYARIVEEERYPFGRAVLSATLRFAGVLPKQIARRQKKRMSG